MTSANYGTGKNHEGWSRTSLSFLTVVGASVVGRRKALYTYPGTSSLELVRKGTKIPAFTWAKDKTPKRVRGYILLQYFAHERDTELLELFFDDAEYKYPRGCLRSSTSSRSWDPQRPAGKVPALSHRGKAGEWKTLGQRQRRIQLLCLLTELPKNRRKKPERRPSG